MFSKTPHALARTSLLAATTAALFCATPSKGDTIFSDGFNYAGGLLSGNSGGTGWSGAWAGGSSLVAGSVPGAGGKSVQISSDATVTSRALDAPISTGLGTTYYVSFVFNANPFQEAGTGDYAGVSLIGTGATPSSFFMGMPGASGNLGFDWANEGDGLYAATSGSNYLTLFKFEPGTESGRTLVSMYATLDLLASGSSLAGGTALASLEGNSFSFDTVEIAGGYNQGSINVAGLALATTPEEAVSFTQSAVPEPGTSTLVALAAAIGGFSLWTKRRAPRN